MDPWPDDIFDGNKTLQAQEAISPPKILPQQWGPRCRSESLLLHIRDLKGLCSAWQPHTADSPRHSVDSIRTPDDRRIPLCNYNNDMRNRDRNDLEDNLNEKNLLK